MSDPIVHDHGAELGPLTVSLARRAVAACLDAAAVVATCLVLFDLAVGLGVSVPVAYGLAVAVPPLLWSLLESRGPGAVGRLASGAALWGLDGSRVSVGRAMRRQVPMGLLLTGGVLFVPALVLLAVAFGVADLVAGAGDPLHRSVRDRWVGTVVVSRGAPAIPDRIRSFAYLESGAPMRYRGED